MCGQAVGRWRSANPRVGGEQWHGCAIERNSGRCRAGWAQRRCLRAGCGPVPRKPDEPGHTGAARGVVRVAPLGGETTWPITDPSALVCSGDKVGLCAA